MKEMNFFKDKVKTVLLGTFLTSIIFSTSVLGFSNNVELITTEEYKEWEKLSTEEKQETLMPRTFDVEIPEDILNSYKINKRPSLITQLLGRKNNFFDNVSAVNDSKYNIANNVNLRVEHQKNTTECWAFSLLKSVETNIALRSGVTELPDFSERHMDYATSRTFLNGINEKGFQRETGRGGLLVVGLAYLTNGQGAVLENEMPFQDNEEKINLEEIDKPVDTIVNDYSILPTIHKTYTRDSNGDTTKVTYKDVDGNEYTDSEIQAIRQIIKKHIVENGAVATMTAGSLPEFYNNSSIFKATAYNCNDSSKVRDHAVTIVGWDDNYSRDNFADGAKPINDGAYIVLNTYGTESFDNGYIYISYEDYFIEQELYGIGSTSNVDYDNLYQHDYYGGIYQLGVSSTEKGFFGVSYDRDSSKEEILDSVGITLCDYANIEVYINPNDNSFEKEKLIKVATSEGTLNPGYHRINITPTQLTGERFAIVVKQVSENGKFYFEIEANVPSTAYELVSSDNKSYISLDGTTWTNLSNLDVSGLDMSKADVCIKAFTKNGKLENEDNSLVIEDYKTVDDSIMDITFNTKKSDFFKNIKTNLIKTIVTKDGNEVTDDEIIKTGMKLKLSDGTTYTLIVRGDINQDGNLTLTDLSKLILHYNGNRGFELEGDALKGADMNFDGVINLVDVSQMVVLYNSI